MRTLNCQKRKKEWKCDNWTACSVRKAVSSSFVLVSHRRDVSCTVGGHHRNHTTVLCNWLCLLHHKRVGQVRDTPIHSTVPNTSKKRPGYFECCFRKNNTYIFSQWIFKSDCVMFYSFFFFLSLSDRCCKIRHEQAWTFLCKYLTYFILPVFTIFSVFFLSSFSN